MRPPSWFVWLTLAAGAGTVAGQPVPKDPSRNVPADLQTKIDAAIEKGTKALIAAAPKLHEREPDHSELALYTLHHAHLPLSDSTMQLLIDRITKKPLKTNYNVALQAVALEAVDKVEYQQRIAQCAQHLVDNQCENGKWDYGEPTPIPAFTPSGTVKVTYSAPGGAPPAPLKAGTSAKAAAPSATVPRIRIRQQKLEKREGDNSNQQYVLLGLRSCMMAGIEIRPRCSSDRTTG